MLFVESLAFTPCFVAKPSGSGVVFGLLGCLEGSCELLRLVPCGTTLLLFGFGRCLLYLAIALFSVSMYFLLDEDGRLRAVDAERSLALGLLFAIGLLRGGAERLLRGAGRFLRGAGRFFLRPLASEKSSPSTSRGISSVSSIADYFFFVKKYAATPITATIPTPIPIFAPVLNPRFSGSGVYESLDVGLPPP